MLCLSKNSYLRIFVNPGPDLKRGVLLAASTGNRDVFTLMLPMTEFHNNRTGSRPSQLGSKFTNASRERKVVASLPLSHRNQPRAQSNINDNYCVQSVTRLKDFACVPGQSNLNPSPVMEKHRALSNKSEIVFLHVNSFVANVHSVTGLPQKKGVNPNYCYSQTEIKYVKGVPCVGHLSSGNIVTNVPTALHPPVGARLHQFWEKWEALGSSPKVVTILREGYTLPFRFRPNLTRSPTVISNYVNPQRQSHLLEALSQLTNKNAVEPVANQNSLGFYNRLSGWRPILDLSTLNTFLNTESFKMKTPDTIWTCLQTGEWVTSIDFKDAYFHIPIHSQSRKYMRFHIQGQSYQFKALPFGLSTAPMEFTVVAKEVKLMALQRGIRIHQYLDDWLVRATSHQPCLQHTQTLVALCRELGWLVNEEKSGLDPKQVFNFVGYQFDLGEGKVRPTPECWQTLTDKILSIRSGVSGPTVHVPHRASDSHRKTSPPRWTSRETHTVALEKQLEGTRITRKGDTRSQVDPPSLTRSQVDPPTTGKKQCSSRSTITPTKTCSADIYRRIKRRVGHSIKRMHCKGNLVSSRKQVAHKSLGTKGGLSGLQRVPRPLFKQYSPDSHRQHNSGCLYQQRAGDEVGLPVCPTVENPVLVYQETGNPQSMSHPRPAECDSRQAIQTRPDHSDGMVPSPRGVQDYMLPVAPATGGPVCHQIQQQTTIVCITGSRPPGMGSGCTQPVLGKSGPICLPTSSRLGQSGGEVAGLPLQQDHSDCPRVAQHALVLGSSVSVQSDPPVSA